MFLTEICQKTYSLELKDDELFFISSQFENEKVSILFSTRTLVNNLLKQTLSQQPPFIHLDSTFKLIDLGLPIVILSTETIAHNFRPIAFLVAWSESKEQISEMLEKFSCFLRQEFNFSFKPKYILSDNSDAIISGCRKAFTHEYTHLLCHFHIMKNIREKTQKNSLKEYKSEIMFGVKVLKNSQTLSFFKNAWKIIRLYWEEKGVSESFNNSFEQEYINKKVQWHYGASFPGKSRSNNSLESGNKVLKDFFNRKAHNIKEFLGKMKDFLREWSMVEKSSFPLQVELSNKAKKQAENIITNASFLESKKTRGFLYCTRKGIEIDELEMALERYVSRKPLPINADDLFENWGYFRTINIIEKTCDCVDFFKYSYCKHVIALMMMTGELEDPSIKEKKKVGRKPHITKALQR